MWLFLLFLLVPLIEIALFIQVGGLIGLWPTLAVVIITAMAGTYLVRSQGREALAQMQRSFNELRDPTEPLAHGAMILFSGALLLTPGFFTDAVGFALLIPAVRVFVFSQLRARMSVHASVHMSGNAPRPARDDVIDADYTVEDQPRRSGPSNWTRD